jgi:hypothetical protein
MLDVAKARADMMAAPGDHLVYTKAQAAQLLDEAELGQQARRTVRAMGAVLGIAAPLAGASA